MRIPVSFSLSMAVLAVAAASLSPMPSAGAASPARARHWAVVDSPSPGSDAYLADVAASSATDAWAVGQYSVAPPGKRIKTLVEHWDGTVWQVMPAPSPGTYTGFSAVLELSPGDVWAAGSSASGDAPDQTLIEHWDGAAWAVVPSPSPGQTSNIYDLLAVPGSGRLWAVGSTQQTAFDVDVPLVESWNGSRWKVVKIPVPKHGGFLFGGTAISADDAWAVGQVSDGNGRPLIEHWNGTAWVVIPSAPGVDGSLDETAAASGTDVWAVGYGYPAGAVAEHWDGLQMVGRVDT